MSPAKRVAIFSALITAPIVLAVLIWLVPAMIKARETGRFMIGFTAIHDAKTPLPIAQVETLLGRPIRIDHSDSTGLTGDVYYYPAEGRTDLKVVFVNGVVFHTQTVSGAKS